MDKAILIIDMPESCDKCPLVVRTGVYDSCCITGTCIISNDNFKFSWCPLKPMPRMRFTYIGHDDEATANYNRGWNDCLEKIKGE